MEWLGRIRELDAGTFKVAAEETNRLLEQGYAELAEEVARETVLVMENDRTLGKEFLKKTREWLGYINSQGERWPWCGDLSEEGWLIQKERFGTLTVAKKYVALVRPVSCAAYPSNNYKFDARTLIEKLLPRLLELGNDLDALYLDIGYLTRIRQAH